MKSFSASWNELFGVMKCFSTSWNNFGVMKCILASWNDFCSVMSSKSASWKIYQCHEIILLASWKYFGVMRPLFSVMKRFSRHETTFGVMKTISPQSCRFVSRVMKVWSAAINPHMLSAVNTAWLGEKAHHTMMYKCLSIFILSCLHAELLLVLCIVTDVSIARTGCSICWQIVQFWTFCGGQTPSAGSVVGGL